MCRLVSFCPPGSLYTPFGHGVIFSRMLARPVCRYVTKNEHTPSSAHVCHHQQHQSMPTRSDVQRQSMKHYQTPLLLRLSALATRNLFDNMFSSFARIIFFVALSALLTSTEAFVSRSTPRSYQSTQLQMVAGNKANFGIFSPAVYFAKSALGEAKLNKVHLLSFPQTKRLASNIPLTLPHN